MTWQKRQARELMFIASLYSAMGRAVIAPWSQYGQGCRLAPWARNVFRQAGHSKIESGALWFWFSGFIDPPAKGFVIMVGTVGTVCQVLFWLRWWRPLPLWIGVFCALLLPGCYTRKGRGRWTIGLPRPEQPGSIIKGA